jgi:hypothetical protein
MDVHIPRAITLGLRLRAIDVLTAQENGGGEMSDPELLDRATELERVVFTFDDDLLVEASERQNKSEHFTGVIYAHPLMISIGKCVGDLEMIVRAGKPEDVENRVTFLPL